MRKHGLENQTKVCKTFVLIYFSNSLFLMIYISINTYIYIHTLQSGIEGGVAISGGVGKKSQSK